MGIKGLSKFIKPHGIKKNLCDYSNKSFAVDTSIYLYRYKYNTVGSDFIKKFITQLINFKENGITPVYIFEGKPPLEKKVTNDKRKSIREKQTLDASNETDAETRAAMEKNIIKITKEDTDNLKKLFTVCNVNFIECEDGVEGERYCSFLNKSGYVDAVLSNDFDSLTFGCKKLVTFNLKNEYIEYDLDNVLSELQISYSHFIDMCIACGTDYYPQGVFKYGPVKSLNSVKSFGEIENWGVTIEENFDIEMIRSIFKIEPEFTGCWNINYTEEPLLDLNDVEDFLKSIDVSFRDNSILEGLL